MYYSLHMSSDVTCPLFPYYYSADQFDVKWSWTAAIIREPWNHYVSGKKSTKGCYTSMWPHPLSMCAHVKKTEKPKQYTPHILDITVHKQKTYMCIVQNIHPLHINIGIPDFYTITWNAH